MTRQEACSEYGIPESILDKCEGWGLCSAAENGSGPAGTDPEMLNLVLMLFDIGFEDSQVEAYMRLAQEGGKTLARRMVMLNQKRREALEEIHSREKQLDRLDHLRYELRMEQSKN